MWGPSFLAVFIHLRHDPHLRLKFRLDSLFGDYWAGTWFPYLHEFLSHGDELSLGLNQIFLFTDFLM
jgi:hypothetical protein